MLLQIAISVAAAVTLFLVFGAVRDIHREWDDLDSTDLLIEGFFTACVLASAGYSLYAVWA